MSFCCGREVAGERSAMGIGAAHTPVRSGTNHANAYPTVFGYLVKCRQNDDWRIP